MSNMSLHDKYRMAHRAAYKATVSVFVHRYADGTRKIAYSQPCDMTRHLSTFKVSHYAQESGVSVVTARKHLKELASRDLIIMRGKKSGVLVFSLNDCDSDRQSYSHIQTLLRAGLQFSRGTK